MRVYVCMCVYRQCIAFKTTSPEDGINVGENDSLLGSDWLMTFEMENGDWVGFVRE